jgi:hypothetical protein
LNPATLASNHGFNGRELGEIERLIQEHHQQLLEGWNDYFS